MSSTVTIIPPSPLDLQRRPWHASTGGNQPSASARQRPKLSVNTTCPQQHTLGKVATGLRLDKLSAETPTIHNTYRNSYGNTIEGPQYSPLNASTPHPHAQLTLPNRVDDKPPNNSQTSTGNAPYVLGKHPRSILVNGPLVKRARSKIGLGGEVATQELSQGPSPHVAFPEPLAEDIHTTRYIAQHFDLLSQVSRNFTLLYCLRNA